jgi:hypothetical protein
MPQLTYRYLASAETTPASSDDSDPEFDNKDGKDFLANGVEAIIERPGRPSSGEARCLKMMTQDKEELWQKKFNMYVASHRVMFSWSDVFLQLCRIL